MIYFWRNSLSTLLFLTLLAPNFARAESTTPPKKESKTSIEALVDGPPANLTEVGNSAYIQLYARRPANARFVFVNFPLFDEFNVSIPPSGFTPDVEKQYGEALHWVIADTQNQADYAEGGRKVMAGFYGGTGISTNYGDGRVFTIGNIQEKYVGKTGLSANDGDFVHSYGRGPLSRGISEVLWGEVGQDFPWGANRVFFVSDRGTNTVWPNGGIEREGLIGRKVPTRPAHYFEKLHEPLETDFSPENTKSFKAQDQARIQEAVQALPDALPKPLGFDPNSSTKEKLRAGMVEYVDRLAEQYAFEKANRFFKADLSSSNFEINGGLLDFDSMTAQPHYMILRTPSKDVLGGTDDIKSRLIDLFYSPIEKYLPKGVTAKIPSLKELHERFDTEYKFRLQRNFVELTGLPRDLISRISLTPQGRVEIEQLGELLHKTAFEGSDFFILKDSMPQKAPKYDLPRILVSLASRNPLEAADLKQVISEDIPDQALRNKLLTSYESLMRHAVDLAQADGIEPQALQKFTYENARLRNADISDMHRPLLRKENERLVDEYLKTGNRSLIWDSINQRVQKNRRVYKSDSPYELILSEYKDPIQGITARKIYNAQTDRFETVIRASVHGKMARFFSHEIPVNEIKNARLLHSADEWKQEIKPKVEKEYIEFRIPTDAESHHVKMALRSQDGTKWWKAGNKDAEVAFIKHSSIPAHPASANRALPKLEFKSAARAATGARPAAASRLGCIEATITRGKKP